MSVTSPYAATAHEGGFLARRKTSPIGIGGAIAIHIGVAAVILLMPGMPLHEKITYAPFLTPNVPADKPPPDKTPPQKHEKTLQKPAIDTPKTIVNLPTDTDFVLPKKDPPPIQGTFDPNPRIESAVLTPPVPKPVFVDSRLDPRYARNLQPDYPPARLREEEEGKVTVRVHIGVDGRVLAVEEVFASNPDFWRATQAQALKAWRFVPATRDGVAVESVREMTVYFRMQS